MLNGAGLSAEIQAALPWTGTQLANFCGAIGRGVVLASSGILTFTTADSGTRPGSGNGLGTGVKGMSAAAIQALIFSTGQGFWSAFQNNGPGSEWSTFCQIVASTIELHFKNNATLTSTHTPVFSGTGTVLVYAGVTIPAMKASIVSEAPGSWASWRFPELAEAVATGVVTELTGHAPIDTVAISGSPSGPTSSGSGSGSGIVT